MASSGLTSRVRLTSRWRRLGRRPPGDVVPTTYLLAVTACNPKGTSRLVTGSTGCRPANGYYTVTGSPLEAHFEVMECPLSEKRIVKQLATESLGASEIEMLPPAVISSRNY